ncbi:MAG: ParB/RepB/Spo0J family partition protein [Rhodospirillaceae bacterium]|nr:ParB/RepB/Spo0J family partition protein [Rhodospirillaceae bacterium]
MKPPASTPKRHLGRGLSALLGGDDAGDAASPAANAARAGARGVPIEHLHPGRFQPRRRFDQKELSALAQSIRINGMLQPILVRPHPTKPGEYEIVAGERRWRAAQEATLHEVPIVERALDDRGALELAILENVQRADLTPVEEAEGYRRLIEEFGHTQELLATELGKSRSHVTNLLRLLSLPEPVRAMIDNGELRFAHARALVGRGDAHQLAKQIVAEGLSARQVEALVSPADPARGRRKARGAGSGKKAPGKDADTRALERDLTSRLGLRVSIEHKGAKGGTISIRYADLDQLDGLIEKLR